MHHRQRRREGLHAIENLVLLCPTDHDWAHAHPAQAREEGLIIPTAVGRSEIAAVPLHTAWGWRRLTEDGDYIEEGGDE